MEIQETVKKSTSERISELLQCLSKDQLRFVVALQDHPSKKDAAESIGLEPNTVYKWNGIVNELSKLMALEKTETARQIRLRNLNKAMMVKVAGLDSEDERIRQNVSTEIIEGELGKATNKTELTGNIITETKVNDEQFDRTISTFADAIGAILSRKSTEPNGAVDPAE